MCVQKGHSHTSEYWHIPRKKLETSEGLRHSADDGVESSLRRWQDRVQPRGRGECHCCIPRIFRMESPKSAGKSTRPKKKLGNHKLNLWWTISLLPQNRLSFDVQVITGDLSDTGRIEPLAAHAGRSGRCLKRSAVKRLIQINSRPRYGGCWWNIDVSACHGSTLRILLDDVVQNAIKKTWPTNWDIFCLNASLNGVNHFRPSSFGQLSHPLGEIHGPCNFVQLRLLLKKGLAKDKTIPYHLKHLSFAKSTRYPMFFWECLWHVCQFGAIAFVDPSGLLLRLAADISSLMETP